MKKRMLSILLAIVVVVGLLPVTAFAAGATNIKVSNPVYYDSGALKSITASFGWSGGLPSGRLVLTTKYLRSEGSNGYAYGDFSDLGYYAKNFNFRSFDDVLAHDQANGDLGIITYTEQKSISSSNNSMTFSFAENNIPLSIDGTYYVYFWTIWGGKYYPDNLIMAIEVKNGGVSYTVADSSKGRNVLSGTSNQVTSSNTYNVTVTATENMTKTDDSGAVIQSNLNSAMMPVVFTANDGYTFPENYAVNTTNGIMVRRDNAEQITVYGTPTSNTTITLPAPTFTGYRVSFDANGGTGTVPTQDATAQGGTFTIPDADGLTKDGYTFSGWNDGEKTYAAGDTYTMPAKNVTFTANWEETVARYDVWVAGEQFTSKKLTINGATGTATYDPDTNTLTLNNFSYTGQGYVYDSPWCAAIFSKNDLAVEVVGSNTVTASVTGDYTAEALNVWGALTITGDSGSSLTLTGAGRDGVGCGGNLKIENVTVNATGTSGLYSDEGNITINNAEVTATATTNQMQYAAAIYAYEGNITIENSTVTANAPYANAVYSYKSYLRYTIKNSNVTISAAQMGIGLTPGTMLIVENSTVEVTSDAGLAIVNIQNNFGAVPRFTGTHVVYAGDDAGSATKADASADATYANKYVQIVPAYTVTYKADGKVVDTVEVEHGKDATAPEIPAKAGHTAAWDKDGKNITADTEINAVYTINKYTVTYKIDGEVVETVEVEHGKDAVAPEVPAKEGYTGTWDSDGKNITADTTINAVYTVHQYTITFDTDGGTEIAAITQDYGTIITAPAAPTKTGYTFAGWDAEIPATMPAKNMTIKAKWDVNQYTITFDTDGGTEITAIIQDYGTAITAPEDPAKTGYTFAGWDAEIPATMPAKNMTIKANWTANKYTITFDTDGGTEIAVITLDYGTAITAPAAPTKTGYTFAGWDAEIPATMPDHDVLLTAKWVINMYTVTYKADDKVVKTMEVEHGKDVDIAEVPQIPAKEGYDEVAPKWDGDGKNITENTTINAVYTINEYTVTYKAGDEVIKIVKVEHGKDVDVAEVPQIPAKEGYDEVAPKWDSDGKNITADTVINAVYTKNQPGEYADVTPETNVGGGKFTEEITDLKEKIPFTQEEEKQIEHGADVEIWLEIKDISASVPAADKNEIAKKLGNGKVAMYLDVAMYKQVGGNNAFRLIQLNDKVQITFALDDSYINTDKNVTRTYSIIRVHNGTAEVIDAAFDAQTKTLTFLTDRFSTYALVCTDVVNVPPTEVTTPSANVPATGDSFDMMMWATMLVVCGVVMLVLITNRKRFLYRAK